MTFEFISFHKFLQAQQRTSTLKNMSVESSLCRELDIRFIDARELVNEAKLKLNLPGYVNKDQHAFIQEEAVRIFEQRDVEEQRELKRANWDLESVKIPNGSLSMSEWRDSSKSSLSQSTHSVSSENPSRMSSRSKMLSLRRNRRTSM